MRAVVAFDKFKGCLNAYAAGAACARGIRKALPGTYIAVVPVADGGDGTTAVIAASRGIHVTALKASDPVGRVVKVAVAVDGDSAWFDVASVAGLAMLPKYLLNPLHTTTRGVGELIVALARAGVRYFNIGAGGSATVDGGRGALEAMGFRFGAHADTLRVPAVIGRCRFRILCDVTNPLNGSSGAARVFGPQKGADPDVVELLARRLEDFSAMMPPDVVEIPRGGAAGGLAAGFAAFLGAELCDGAAVCLDAVGFDRVIDGADFIVTGEGCLDSQTLSGKGPGLVLAKGLARGIPVHGLAGRVEDESELLRAGFASVTAVSDAVAPASIVMRPEYAREKICKFATQMFGFY